MSDILSAPEIAALRASKGWSTYEMAKFLGCNQSTVWRMEHGGNISGPARKLLQTLKTEVEQTESV